MTIHIRARHLLTVAAVTLSLAESRAFAFDPPTQTLAQRIASADAVVQATVVNVEYRLSTSDTTRSTVPFTFVTFDVERVLRGQVDGSRLTLRFHGGLFPDGRFMDDPTTPLFDVGERSLLLVSGNGVLDAPLAGWRFGRLRVIDGRVYDDFGKPLSILGPNLVTFGKAVWFDEVATHRLMSGRSFNPRIRELPVSPDTAGTSAAIGSSPSTAAVGLDAFIAWVRALPPAAGASQRVARSVDPNVPFLSRSLAAVAPAR